MQDVSLMQAVPRALGRPDTPEHRSPWVPQVPSGVGCGSRIQSMSSSSGCGVVASDVLGFLNLNCFMLWVIPNDVNLTQLLCGST